MTRVPDSDTVLAYLYACKAVYVPYVAYAELKGAVVGTTLEKSETIDIPAGTTIRVNAVSRFGDIGISDVDHKVWYARVDYSLLDNLRLNQ